MALSRCLPGRLPRLRGADGLCAVRGGFSRPDSMSAVHLPARRFHLDGRVVSHRRFARAARRRALGVLRAGVAGRGVGHRGRGAPPVSAEPAARSGTELRSWTQLHVADLSLRANSEAGLRGIRRMRTGELEISRASHAGLDPDLVRATRGFLDPRRAAPVVAPTDRTAALRGLSPRSSSHSETGLEAGAARNALFFSN